MIDESIWNPTREQRTPAVEVLLLMGKAYELYEQWFGEYLKSIGKDVELSFNEHYPIHDDNNPPPNGDDEVEEFFDDLEINQKETEEIASFRALHIACAYARQSLSVCTTDVNLAWTMIADANYWIGLSKGFNTGNVGTKVVDYSLLGKMGAKLRHNPMNKLKAWTIEQYKAGSWKSANQAAHILQDKVIKHGKTINAYLTEQNAQRTIADWIRKSV